MTGRILTLVLVFSALNAQARGVSVGSRPAFLKAVRAEANRILRRSGRARNHLRALRRARFFNTQRARRQSQRRMIYTRRGGVYFTPYFWNSINSVYAQARRIRQRVYNQWRRCAGYRGRAFCDRRFPNYHRYIHAHTAAVRFASEVLIYHSYPLVRGVAVAPYVYVNNIYSATGITRLTNQWSPGLAWNSYLSVWGRQQFFGF